VIQRETCHKENQYVGYIKMDLEEIVWGGVDWIGLA
jgi:hypothetical protein